MGMTAAGLPSVDAGSHGGAPAVIKHLMAQGRRRIAMIAGPRHDPCAAERVAGYRSAVGAAGLPETLVGADFTRLRARGTARGHRRTGRAR